MKITASLMSVMLLVPAVPAAAQTAPPVKPDKGPLDSVQLTPLTADWKPRKDLADKGVTFSVRVIAEAAVNDRGYTGSASSYVQDVTIGATLDLDRLRVANDSTLRIVFSDRLGNGLSARTGAYIQNQAFAGQGRNVRFDEISLERTFLDKRLSLKGGFYSMGNDFAGLPYTCNFNNNGNCGHPLGLLYGSGWLDSPTGQWGARAKWSDRSGWYAQAGMYDVTPARKTAGHGFDLGFPGETTGFIAPVEIGYVHGKTPSDYAGTFKLGGYYDSSRAARIGVADRKQKGRYGVYLQAAQQIWKPSADTRRGIAIFGVATLSDRDTALFRTSFEAGASWRGLLKQREDDVLSISWVNVDINSRLTREQRRLGEPLQTSEELVELNYGAKVAHWLLIRPAFQYAFRPGGYSTRPDTAVATLHLQVSL